MENAEWIGLGEVSGSATKANVTLPIRTPTEVQLNAVNGVGESSNVTKLVKPPLYYHSGKLLPLCIFNIRMSAQKAPASIEQS